MRKIFTVGLMSAALGFALVGAAMAQDAPAPAVKSGPPSVDWPISDLLADAGSKAVLVKDLPALVSYDGLDQIKGMSIRQISQFPQANIDAAKLASVQADLSAGSGTTTTTTTTTTK
jgi:ketopantoate hydroxymethyltransferase